MQQTEALKKTSIYTEYGVDIELRIALKKTRLFSSKETAKQYADEQKSYIYPVYNEQIEQVFWAVPK